MLSAAVVVLAVLVVVDLAVTLALVGRVRALTAVPRPARAALVDGPATGTPVPAVVLAAVGGAEVDLAEAARGDLLVAFVAAGCTPCHEQLPALRALVAARAGHGGRAVVVVLAPDGDPGEFVPAFEGLAPVAVEGADAALAGAFAIGGYPTYVECSAGTVAAVHATVPGVPQPARP